MLGGKQVLSTGCEYWLLTGVDYCEGAGRSACILRSRSTDRVKKSSGESPLYFCARKKLPAIAESLRLSDVAPLDGTGNLAGAEAPSTYVDMAGSTVHESFYTTDIGFPSSVGTSMRVRNLNTKGNALAANIALCHFPAPPYLKGIE